jgi:AraC-like DNA-binding protein
MQTAASDTTLQTVLDTVARVSGYGGIYQPLEGRESVLGSKVNAFCVWCLNHPVVGAYCRYACRSATLQALASGEPHYQHCWAGLLCAVAPVAPRGICRGGIEMGGFYMEDAESEVEAAIRERLRAFAALDAAPFVERLTALQPIGTQALRGLGFFLLETTFSTGLNPARFFQRQQDRYLQQRHIAEAASKLRADDTVPHIVADAYQLLEHLQRGDRARAMALISEYLARLLMASNWNLVKLQAHVRVLLAVMSSQSVLDGETWPAVMNRELRCMTRIEAAADPESLCYEVAEFVMRHFRREPASDWREGPLGGRIMNWMQRHYAGCATIAEAARAVGASRSSIGHRLPEETGKTFAQLRMEVRLAEAKRLLATTDLELSAVAAACGFADQSHMTRAMKRAINLTPGQFRSLLHAST